MVLQMALSVNHICSISLKLILRIRSFNTCPRFDPNYSHSLNAGNDTLEFATGSGNGFIERQTGPSPHGLVVETTLVTQNTSSIWVIYNQTDISNAQHVGLAMQVRPVRTDGSLRTVKTYNSSSHKKFKNVMFGTCSKSRDYWFMAN